MQRAAATTMVFGLATVLVGSFLPWASSGARERSSYELVRVAGRLDLVPSGWPSVAAKSWFAVPLAAAISGSAALWTRWHVHRMGAVLGLAVAAFAFGLVTIVQRSPLPTDVGTTVSTTGAAITALGAICLLAAVHPRNEESAS